MVDTIFVWAKMGVESGEGLSEIIARKEKERAEGGTFWWGIGSSLGPNVGETARKNGGTLPVIFSKMISTAKSIDIEPGEVWEWSAWEDFEGGRGHVPSHVKIISRGALNKKKHYALVCASEDVLTKKHEFHRFDSQLCRTLSGKSPGPSQVTAVLKGSTEGHNSGKYEISFRAKLVKPWFVKLVAPKRLK